MAEENKIFEWSGSEPKKLEELPTEVKLLFEYLKQHYLPADAGTATIRKTTREIAEELFEHSGTPVPTDLVFKFLNDNGFSYSGSGTDMQFTWLIKTKT